MLHDRMVFTHALHHAGHDEAGRDHVGADPVPAELDGERADDRTARPFGRGIVGDAADALEHRKAAAEDEAAARLATLGALHHQARALLQREEGAVKAGGEQIVPLRLVELQRRSGHVARGPAGIGEDAVDATVLRHQRLVAGDDRRARRHVDRPGSDPDAECF